MFFEPSRRPRQLSFWGMRIGLSLSQKLGLLLYLWLSLLSVRAQQPAPAPASSSAQPAPRTDDERRRTDWADLARYAAANARLPPPRPGRPRVVLLGNSITEGWSRADSAFFQDPAYELINRGISGQTSGQLLLRCWPDVIALRPAVLVLLGGVNDVAENNGPYDPVATERNLEAVVELAQAHGIRVVLCSVLPAYDFWWRPGREPALKIVALNARLRACAARHRATYLDYHAALADARQGLPPAYAPDGVHPNLAGYRVMEGLLRPSLRRVLR